VTQRLEKVWQPPEVAERFAERLPSCPRRQHAADARVSSRWRRRCRERGIERGNSESALARVSQRHYRRQRQPILQIRHLVHLVHTIIASNSTESVPTLIPNSLAEEKGEGGAKVSGIQEAVAFEIFDAARNCFRVQGQALSACAACNASTGVLQPRCCLLVADTGAGDAAGALRQQRGA
jgi:hypothetical protein